jgi:hypothetical protein
MPIIQRASRGTRPLATAEKDKAGAKQSDANPNYTRPFTVLPRTNRQHDGNAETLEPFKVLPRTKGCFD